MKRFLSIALLAGAVLALIQPVIAATYSGTPRVEAVKIASSGAGTFTNTHPYSLTLLQRVDLLPVAATASGTVVTVSLVNPVSLTNGTVSVTQSFTIPASQVTSAVTNGLDSSALYIMPNGVVSISGLSTNGTVLITGVQLPQ